MEVSSNYFMKQAVSFVLIGLPGIGPKVTQSVLTAAFLFAFKDALYDATIKARHTIASRRK